MNKFTALAGLFFVASPAAFAQAPIAPVNPYVSPASATLVEEVQEVPVSMNASNITVFTRFGGPGLPDVPNTTPPINLHLPNARPVMGVQLNLVPVTNSDARKAYYKAWAKGLILNNFNKPQN